MSSQQLIRLHLPLLLFLVGCQHESRGPETAPLTPAATKDAPAPGAVPESVELPPNAPQLSRIKIEAVETATVAVDEIVAPGAIEANPNRISHVSVPVSGRVSSVLVKLGDFVSEGQSLFTMESPDIESAELAHRQALNAVAQARANEAKVQTDLDRLNDLFSHQAVAQKEVIAAENALTLAKLSVQEAGGVRQQTLRRLELMGLKPGDFGQKMTVRSPLAGKVLNISLVAGEYRNDLAAPVLTIADLRTVWASSNVPESYIRHCRLGGRVSIELVAFPGEQFEGRVSHIADTVDPETRTVKVRAELNNSSGRFRPEMFGRIRYGEAKQPLPVIAETAVLQHQGQSVVFVEDRPGHFVRRQVMVGVRVGEKVAIPSGLRAGEHVVTSGAIHLKGGL
jgi:cobalt-zinc-cadmium efflux system membrane fusion protein